MGGYSLSNQKPKVPIGPSLSSQSGYHFRGEAIALQAKRDQFKAFGFVTYRLTPTRWAVLVRLTHCVMLSVPYGDGGT